MSKYCAVQLRVPVRVIVLSNSTAVAVVADVEEMQESGSFEVCVKKSMQKKVSCRKKEKHSIFPCAKRFREIGRKKVLKSDHPTEFGKISKEKNTTVTFKEKKRTRFCRTTTK